MHIPEMHRNGHAVKTKRYIVTLQLLEVSMDELNTTESRAIQTVYLQFPFKCRVGDAPGCTLDADALQEIVWDMCRHVEKIWTAAIERMKTRVRDEAGEVLDIDTASVQLAVAAWQRADTAHRKAKWESQRMPETGKRLIQF
jgi:hypothetical protein